MHEFFFNKNRLTKRFLMTHRKGAYIVSNCYKPVGPNKFKPIFEEEAVALEQRQVQWEHIKAAHADGSLCRVYISREYYEECESSRRRFAALKKKHIFNRRISSKDVYYVSGCNI